MLTLRDATGVKLAKPLTAGANGVVRFDEALPPNLRYGCAVCVQYPESATNTHADQRDLFVIPSDRTLTVTTTTPDTVGPGAEVKLGLQVNREEEVDLVVSVFDESLLGVSGDLSQSIRDHFLADVRGQGRAARDLAATRLGGVGIAELVAKAEKMLKDKDALAKEPGLEQRLTQLSTQWKAGKLTIHDAVTLVRLAGFEVYLAQPLYAYQPVEWRVPKSARLANLMRRDGIDEEKTKLYLSATVIDSVVLLGLADRRGGDPWVMHRGNFYQNQPCYGFGCGGFQQFGNQFCGGFQCGGFQFNGWQFGGQFNGGFGGSFGFGGSLGNLGVGGGIAGFGGGGFGGMPSGQAAFSNVVSGNGLFSQPFVGGQMGMSFGFNRDFGGAPRARRAAPRCPGWG